MATTTVAGDRQMEGLGKEQVEAAKKRNEEETETDQYSLTQAKDRAQVTSSTAMSVVNIALLREIMDRGPEGNRFYTASLWIISAALVLQILAGVLSIMVSNIISYRNKFGSNVCDDITKNLCPCTCVIPSKKKKAGKSSESNASSLGHGDSTIALDDEDVGCCSWWPYDLTTEAYPEFEKKTIDQYHRLRHEMVAGDLDVITASAELKFQTAVVEEARKQMSDIDTKLKVPALDKDAEKELNESLAKVKADLAEALKSKTDYEAQIRKKEITEEQGNLLKVYAESYRKKRIMKLVAFWQDIINYLLYTVFILNAFLVGFGIARSAPK